VAANYAALFPATLEVPFLLLGIVVSVAAATGALACGWACPFGFLQDLLGKVVPNKLTVPGWTGHGRFVVLIGVVLLTPMFFGWRGIPFEEQVVSICRLCPAGALEAGLPYSTQALMAGNGWTMSWLKTGILFSFLLGAIFIHRPWCRMLCPLGGFLALFNRVSLYQRVNVAGCIRCLECTTCGALEPALAVPGKLMDKPSAIKTDPRNVHNDH
jgi:polyferredoxin